MRIDMLPTDCCGTYKIRPGIFLRNGASIVPGGVNFSVYSSGAKACELVLFWNHAQKPFAVIPFPESYRVGNVFAMIVFALDYENLEYGFRIDGTWNPLQGELYDGRRCLLDWVLHRLWREEHPSLVVQPPQALLVHRPLLLARVWLEE